MALALHFQPDPTRHIAKLPYILGIDGMTCLKVYASESACVYLQYGVEGDYLVYEIVRVNNGEQLGNLLASVSDLAAAMDTAGAHVVA